MSADLHNEQRIRLWLALIVLLYLALAGTYALFTPAWQVPDEPAHYNYVQRIAETGRLPELRPGDYPAAYLEEIKAARFAPEYSVDPIRYESHQPPLYYLLATPVFLLSRALGMETPLLPLRLFTTLLGCLSLLVAFGLVRALAPNRPELALGAAAFMAFLPMRLAIAGAVNNDVLVELILALTAWQLVVVGKRGWTVQRSVLLGLTIGPAFLTKLQAYVAAPLAFFAWAWAMAVARRTGRRIAPLLAQGTVVLAIALACVAPWLARNASVYGPNDLLGMVRHDAVAGGQLTSAALIAERGVAGTLRSLVQTTFQSFWGQFGWMGVPLPSRVYQGLAALTGVALLGVLDTLPTVLRRVRRGDSAYHVMLLGAWGLLTVAGFLWYNLQFVQHQGRYLFPALPVWALLFTVGMQRLYSRAPRWILSVLGACALLLLIAGLLAGNLRGFALLLVIACGGVIVVGHEFERRWPGTPLAATALAPAGLAAWCLTVLVPALTP